MLLPLADGDAMTLNPTCFANTAKLEIAFSESDDINIRVCIGKDSEKVGGQLASAIWVVSLIGSVLHIREEVASILQYHTVHRIGCNCD